MDMYTNVVELKSTNESMLYIYLPKSQLEKNTVFGVWCPVLDVKWIFRKKKRFWNWNSGSAWSQILKENDSIILKKTICTNNIYSQVLVNKLTN